jgi:hypothetical protein
MLFRTDVLLASLFLLVCLDPCACANPVRSKYWADLQLALGWRLREVVSRQSQPETIRPDAGPSRQTLPTPHDRISCRARPFELGLAAVLSARPVMAQARSSSWADHLSENRELEAFTIALVGPHVNSFPWPQFRLLSR